MVWVRHHRTGLAASVVGLCVALLNSLGMLRPALWIDEAATLSATRRSFGQLWSMIHQVDVVHAEFYLLMKTWMAIVGTDGALALRLPSVVATGVGSTLTVLLATHLHRLRSGVVAGVILGTMPSVTYFAVLGRSYSLGVMLAAASMLALVLALKRERWWNWMLYVVVTVAMVGVSVYSLLLIPAHMGHVLLSGAKRKSLAWPVVSWGLIAVPSALLAWVSSAQQGQIGWLQVNWSTVGSASLVTAWGLDNVPLAAMLVGLAVVGASALRGTPAAISLPAGLILPVSALLVASLKAPMFHPRYLLFCAPVLATLAGIGVVAAGARYWVGLTCAIVVLSIPSLEANRQPNATQDLWMREVATKVAELRASEPDGAMGVVYGKGVHGWNGGTARRIAIAYRDAFVGLDDVMALRSAEEAGRIYQPDKAKNLAAVTARLESLRCVYVIDAVQDPQLSAKNLSTLETTGFTVDVQADISGERVTRWCKG